MILTKHALIRLKQRGIPKRAMELAIAHGKSGRRAGKVVEYTLSKKEAKFLKSDYQDEKKAIRDIERAVKVAVIVSEKNNSIITAFHRK
jgi:hypothetical protein